MTGPDDVARPLRADAARNHRAIVAAAREAFDEVGPDVALEEIARRAGVGASTLYRRFGSRDDLVAAVVSEYVDETLLPVLARAAAAGDPRHALEVAVDGIARALVHRGQLVRAGRDAGAFTPELLARLIDPLDALLARARDTGCVRPDLRARDVPAVAGMLAAAGAPFDELHLDRWDRYLALLLDALGAGERRPLPPLAD